MDPNTVITLDDGTTTTIGELLEARRDLEDQKAYSKELRDELDNVGLLFRSDVTPDVRREAVRRTLKTQGYDDHQINAYIQATSGGTAEGGEGEGEGDGYVDDSPGGTGSEDEIEEIELPGLEDEDPSGGTQEDDMNNQLQEQLEAQRAELHRMRVRELRDNLNRALENTMKKNPEVQKLLEAAKSLRGDEGVRQAETTLRGQLERQALERMQSRRSQAGTFEDAWMEEEVGKAVEPVVGTFRSVIGDLDRLGRTTETADGLDAQEILKSKPVPAPEWKPGVDFSTLEGQVKDFAADTISRALAASPSESAI
jgi:hypothetical protein